jgi:hypothetical protein
MARGVGLAKVNHHKLEDDTNSINN